MNPADWKPAVDEWRTTVEALLQKEGDTLPDLSALPDLGSPGGRAAVLQAAEDLARFALDQGWESAARRVVDVGMQAALAFSGSGLAQETARKPWLSLSVDGARRADERQDHDEVRQWVRQGIAYSDKLISEGVTASWLPERFTALLGNAVNTANRARDYGQSLAWARQSIACAEELISEGVTEPWLPERYSGLLVNALNTANGARDYDQGLAWARQGIAYAEKLTSEGATEPWLPERYLVLLVNALNTANGARDYDQGLAWARQGIAYAEKLISEGVTESWLPERYLLLLGNAVNTLNGARDYDQGLAWSRQGISIAERLSSEGVKDAWLPYVYLNLLINGIGSANGKLDYDQGLAWSRQGIAYAERLLSEGVTESWLPEKYLGLLRNGVGSAGANLDYDQGLAWSRQGIAYAEKLISEGVTESWLPEAYLGLLGNAVNTVNGAPYHDQGLAWSRQGIAYAERLLSEGVKDAWLPYVYLNLLINGIGSANGKLDYDQGLAWSRQGIAYAERLLSEGVTEPWLPGLYLGLLANGALIGSGAEEYEQAQEWSLVGLTFSALHHSIGNADAQVVNNTLLLLANASAGLSPRGGYHAEKNVALSLWIGLFLWRVRLEGLQVHPSTLSQYSRLSATQVSASDREERAPLARPTEMLSDLFMHWYASDRPHDGLGGAQRPYGEEVSAPQAALTALEGLVLWEHAQENARVRHLFEALANARDTIKEHCLLAADTRARALPRVEAERRRLRSLLRACRGHPLVAWLRLRLHARLQATRQALLPPRADAHWEGYLALRKQLTEWVADAVIQRFDWPEGLDGDSAILLAGAVLRETSAGGDPRPVLEGWMRGSPPWREVHRNNGWIEALAATWPGREDAPVDHWLATLGAGQPDTPRVTDAGRFGPAPQLDQAFAAARNGEPQALGQWLDQAWSRALGRAEVLQRITSVLDSGEGAEAVCPPLPNRSARGLGGELVEPLPEAPLLGDILEWQGWAPGLASEADVVLGVLACRAEQRGEEATEVHADWVSAASLERDSPVLSELSVLRQAWAIGDTEDSGERLAESGVSLRTWLVALGMKDKLNVEPSLLGGSAPLLERAFGAASADDCTLTRTLLLDAWQRMQRTADRAARVCACLKAGYINTPLRIADEQGVEGLAFWSRQEDLYDYAMLPGRHRREALSAILRGQLREYLRESARQNVQHRLADGGVDALLASVNGRATAYLREHVAASLDREGAITRSMPLDQLGSALDRLFAAAIHRHPGRPAQGLLTERLHNWALAALREACERADLEGIWSALETGRVALSGLAVQPPGAAWEAHTARMFFSALAYGVERDASDELWRRGWPPLTAWISACADLRPNTTVGVCQDRMRPGDALVQPFFVPDSGAMRVLWLNPEGELKQREFSEDCDEHRWKESILAPWEEWLEGVTQGVEVRAWRKLRKRTQPTATRHGERWADILGASPVRCFVQTLSRWAQEEGVERLLMVLPAPLAQLPWESLHEVRQQRGHWVRLVSLSSWLNPRTDAAAQGRWTCYNDEGDPAFRFAPLEARRVDTKPLPNVDCTSVDVLSGLSTHARAHIILHGRYQRFAPLRSGVEIRGAEAVSDPVAGRLVTRSSQFLPLWAPAALGVRTELLVLSACESNLAGQATHNLLGPVGIGPACVAAGAGAVVGTLWPCQDLATVAFVDYLQSITEAEAGRGQRPLQLQVAEAAQRLRRMTGQELRAMVMRLAPSTGEDVMAAYGDELETRYFSRAHPFENPKFWASYVVLGEWPRAGQQTATDPVAHT